MWPFNKAIFGKRSEPPPPVEPSFAPMSTRGTTSAPTKATGGRDQFACFHRCLARFPHLAPRDRSVGAFVAWMQELGEAGQHDYAELVEYYATICELTGAAQMPPKWLWRGLEQHGCHRWQELRFLDGHRWRPYVVWIPTVASDRGNGVVIPNGKVEAIRALKRAAGSRSGASRFAGNRQGKGGRYSADIPAAVASHG